MRDYLYNKYARPYCVCVYVFGCAYARVCASKATPTAKNQKRTNITTDLNETVDSVTLYEWCYTVVYLLCIVILVIQSYFCYTGYGTAQLEHKKQCRHLDFKPLIYQCMSGCLPEQNVGRNNGFLCVSFKYIFFPFQMLCESSCSAHVKDSKYVPLSPVRSTCCAPIQTTKQIIIL